MSRFLSLALVAWLSCSAVAKDTTIDLQYRTVRNWKFELPKPSFRAVSSELTFPNLLTFKSALRGTALAIDTTGDGKLNTVVTGKKGNVILRNRAKKFRYGMRLVNRGGWKFATSGYARGKIDGVWVALIDQNNNGRYDDFGKDAMIVGRSTAASFLSNVVSINGKLYQLKIKPDGSKLTYRPFKGKAGKLDLKSKFESSGKLTSIVVQSLDKKYSFDLSQKAAPVPAGKYRIVTGKIELGQGTVKVTKGKSKPMVVTAGKTTTLTWGGPIKVEFGYQRRGSKVGFSPNHVWYYGKAKEEYSGWTPFGKSPEFVVLDAGGANLAKAVFGGC